MYIAKNSKARYTIYGCYILGFDSDNLITMRCTWYSIFIHSEQYQHRLYHIIVVTDATLYDACMYVMVCYPTYSTVAILSNKIILTLGGNSTLCT